ncbi:MAG: hypothetical protein K2R98_17820 [Gemmataceae bacterium]|nr:hypothetical protein [Gemmataceae bacterium]
MVHGWWKRAGCWLALGGGLWLLAIGTVRADDASPEEMRQRLERLEKQNQELLKRLEAIEPARQGGTVPVLEGGQAEPGTGLNKDEVKKIVGDYLKSEASQKKAADDAKAKAAELEGFEVGKDLKMNASWRNGLWLETADKAFKVHVGGRTQYDTVWMTADRQVQFGTPNGTGLIDDAVNFRRARLAVEGTFWEVMDFNCEYDFLNTLNNDPTLPAARNNVGNTPVPTDLWIQWNRVPYLGNIRVGNQKPPISFEHMTSSRFLDFMERSLAFDAYVEDQDNGFTQGFQLFNWLPNERATWAVGAFKTTRSILGWNVGDGEWGVCGRVTALPYYSNDGRCLVHLGLGARYRDPDEETTRFRSRPLLRNGPAVLHNIIAQAQFLSANETLLVPEFVAVMGPWTVSAEWYASWVQGSTFPITPVSAQVNRGTTFTQGGYVDVLYFLTGEHRIYDKKYPRFDRVVPNENAFLVRGKDGHWARGSGAWQVGARYSYLDLENKGIGVGVIHDVTLGLNWFLNPNSKVQWNYIYEHRDVPNNTASGSIQGVGMRFAFDF